MDVDVVVDVDVDVVVGTHSAFLTNARAWVADVLSNKYILSRDSAESVNSVHSRVPVSWMNMPHCFPSTRHCWRHGTGVEAGATTDCSVPATRSAASVRLARSVRNFATPSVKPASKQPVTSSYAVVVVPVTEVVVVVSVLVVVMVVVVVVDFVVVVAVVVDTVELVLVTVVDVPVVDVPVVVVMVVVVVTVVTVMVVLDAVDVELVTVVVLVVDDGAASHDSHVFRQLC